MPNRADTLSVTHCAVSGLYSFSILLLHVAQVNSRMYLSLMSVVEQITPTSLYECIIERTCSFISWQPLSPCGSGLRACHLRVSHREAELFLQARFAFRYLYIRSSFFAQLLRDLFDRVVTGASNTIFAMQAFQRFY